MGSKSKKNRVFGRSLGRHSRVRRGRHLGRPIYRIKKKSRNIKKDILKIKIKKIHNFYGTTLKKHMSNTSIYTAFSYGDNFRMRILKVKDLSPKGYRMMNLDCLQSHVSEITMHVCLCVEAMKVSSEGKTPIKLQTEVRSLGLASVMMAECQGCFKKFKFDTSPKVPGSKRYDVNVRAVWGSMVTGNGPAHLNELMATLNSPGLSQPTFTSIETDIGKWWHSILEQEMMLAGQEERRLAIDRNDYHHEVPAITVIVDGGWSKRTHKHSYNAAGGVAIIIGKETKKLLHIGVRNKYCYICGQNDNKPHTCFKNWDKDSQSMESDIILEGFKQAEEKHGLRYMRVVGDGDSSVFATIREGVPGWGRQVTKEECANHICKCYRSNLEKMVTENPLYKGRHHLSKTTRVRLVSALRCAIRFRSKELKEQTVDVSTAIKRLRHDIINSVNHVFGQHDHCSDFCRAKTQQTDTSSDINTCTSSNSDHSTASSPTIVKNSDEPDLLDCQIDFWSEGSSLASQEESRLGTTIQYSNVEQHIIKDVLTLLNRIAEKSDRLISNSTTNLAESWMHIRTKFDGGKVYNLCNRGSWHARCYGGALRMNLGPQWSCQAWETCTATEPGKHFTARYKRNEQLLKNSIRHKSKPDVKQKRWKRKISSLKGCTTRKARQSYGTDAIEVTTDVSTTALEKLQNDFLDTHINLSADQCKQITLSTVQQSQSGLWHSERHKRITASNFGSIIRRNPSLPINKFVRNLLYSQFKGNRHTRNGILQEDTTIEEYKLKKAEDNENIYVNKTGLVIHPTNKFLAASPDGIVTSSTDGTGLIEIKNLLHSKPINLFEAANSNNFCLITINGNLKLKENHPYFFQCHGLLNVCHKPWIDFVVRTLNPYQMFIQRIYRDVDLWENTLLPKLKAFFTKALLPELASPREGKSPGIREPGIWVSSILSLKSIQKQPCLKFSCLRNNI
ncbi:uncharacterized protein [Mytilus edulis]|uniref:uncharacterized protein n=1 Tax=Mytilus edulis TaxID=6550 RepID=UPI0039EDFA31